MRITSAVTHNYKVCHDMLSAHDRGTLDLLCNRIIMLYLGFRYYFFLFCNFMYLKKIRNE